MQTHTPSSICVLNQVNHNFIHAEKKGETGSGLPLWLTHHVNRAALDQITLEWMGVNGIVINWTGSCESQTDYAELADYLELDYTG